MFSNIKRNENTTIISHAKAKKSYFMPSHFGSSQNANWLEPFADLARAKQLKASMQTFNLPNSNV